MKNFNQLLPIFLTVLSLTALTAQKVSEREIIALLELQDRTEGHQWTHQWDRSTPIAQWHGVTVKDGKVIGLNLANNNLKGKIPLTIGNLKNLVFLDLSNNQLEGRVPKLLRKFKNLKTFNLANNSFEGELPNSIDLLVSLEELNVVGNKLEGNLPESVTQLKNLRTLAVADNHFSGNLPSAMKELKNLKTLYLANNSFASLDNLRTLSKQQIILTDVDVNTNGFKPFNLNKMTKEGLSKLEFQD